MKTIDLIFVGKSHDDVQSAAKQAKEYITQKGYGKGGGTFVNKAPRSTFRAVIIRGEEPNDKKNNWVKDVFRSTYEIADSQGGSTIYAAKVAFQDRINLDGETVIENIDVPDGVAVQKGTTIAETYSPGNEPFSYDPSRDYYTEPDR